MKYSITIRARICLALIFLLCLPQMQARSLSQKNMQGAIYKKVEPVTGSLCIEVVSSLNQKAARKTRLTEGVFKNAVWASFTSAGLFGGGIRETPLGDYILSVNITRAAFDEVSLHNVTATIEVYYVLSKSNSEDVIWKETVITNGESGLGDGNFQSTQKNYAMENACSENITHLVHALHCLLSKAP